MPNLTSFDTKIQKENSFHLKVRGAYVQTPVPSVVGLDDYEVVSSDDAEALYPTTQAFSNISPDTLYGRVYDTATIQNLIKLIQKAFQYKKQAGLENMLKQVMPSFKNALEVLLKTYYKTDGKSVKNKTDSFNFSMEFYPNLLQTILSYEGELEDIFSPTTDKQYILLRSYFYPLVESIAWLSPQNKKYNQLVIDYIFYEDLFYTKYANKEIYIFENFNNTKIKFKIIDIQELEEVYFKRFLLNPLGTLFYTHDEKLSEEVELIFKALDDRRLIKNGMLALNAINKNIDKVEYIKKLFLTEYGSTGVNYLTEEDIVTIFTELDNLDYIETRITSMKELFFEGKSFDSYQELKKYLKTYEEQLNGFQNGIKVTLNSGYGILGMITFEFADPLCGNSITTAGKILGTKLFQAVSVYVMDKFEERLPELLECYTEDWRKDNWIDIELAPEE